MTGFCVYEHWRPDTAACFYVGKGKMRRARSFEERNPRYGRIVAKLQSLGLKPVVRIIREMLTDPQAIALEIELIAYWRSRGSEITNCTDGGDGASGRLHSDSTKAKIGARAKGRKHSPETIARMVAARTGLKRTVETKRKQSESAKVAQKYRFEKVKSTKVGRAALKLRMTEMSKKAARDPLLRAVRSANAKALWADPSYQEKMKRRRCVPKAVVKGFS